jgi:hypothetical protein
MICRSCGDEILFAKIFDLVLRRAPNRLKPPVIPAAVQLAAVEPAVSKQFLIRLLHAG